MGMDRMFFREKFITECDSTNKYIRQMMSVDKQKISSLVRAGYQINGKGQSDNYWESEESKNLLFSFSMFPNELKAYNQFYISAIVALSLLELLNKYIPEEKIKIKWPNDIYVNKQKIAGILIENAVNGDYIESSIIGIGLNVNQINFSESIPNPVSLAIICGKDFDLQALLNDYKMIFAKSFRSLNDFQYSNIKSHYLSNLFQIDQEHQYKVNNNICNGIIRGVDDHGFLKMEIDKEVRSFDIKDVVYLF